MINLSRLALFLTFFVNLSIQQLPDLKKINDDHADCRNAMIYYESRIAFRLSNFSQQIQKCSNDLKASSKPKSISDALDNFFILTSQIQTVNNFKPFESFDTCKDINYHIILMDLENRKMDWVIKQVNTNITAISQQNSAVMTQYSLNLNRALPYLSTAERSVYQIFTQTSSIIVELSNYLPTLLTCKSKLTTIAVLMNAFRTKYCQCLAQNSWSSTANDSTLKSNVDEFENRLKALQSSISTSASSALTLVKKASSETGNVYMPPLQVVLQRQNRADYPTYSWPNVQNCNDLYNRGKFLVSKQLQYLQLVPTSNLDCSLITFYWTAVTSIRPTSATLNSAMAAVKTVESNCKNYISLLITAYVRISVMASNVNSMGDTFCSCGGSIGGVTTLGTSTITQSTSTTIAPTTTTTTLPPTTTTTTTLPPTTTTTTTSPPTTTTTTTLRPTTTTTSTTTTTTTTLAPTTTTTTPPCGIFVPFDTYNALDGPSLNGFSAGIFEDGSKVYVGYGPNAGCTSQNPCPGRLTDNPAEPGAWYGCAEPYYARNDSYYLLNHPSLNWVATTDIDVLTLPNPPILVGSGFYIGRTIINGFTYVGKIHIDINDNVLYYITSTTEEVVYDFEVLSCAPPTTTTLARCGTFNPFIYLDDPFGPRDQGFSAGDWYDGAKSYVGIGNDPHCNGISNLPARIQISPANPGAYIACSGGLQVDVDTPRYLQNHPNLKWIKPTDPKTDVIKFLDPTFGSYLAIGRINFTSAVTGTLTQVGFVANYQTSPYIAYMLGIDFTDASFDYTYSDFEILSC